MRPILLCTLGTSLFRPNLERLKGDTERGTLTPGQLALAEAYTRREWPAVARALTAIPPEERLCGAEINSIASIIQLGYAPADCGLLLFHSATPDGRHVASILEQYSKAQGHSPVASIEVPDLQDEDPKRFRTHGLRNLVRKMCGAIRERSAAACAINATGGYKAQIAVAVLLGQALGVPVFYKHELFSEIIAFPPLPVALDYEVWMQASGMLFDLDAAHDLTPSRMYADDWDEKYLHFRRNVPVKKLILTENPALRDVAFFRSGTSHWEGKGWPSVSVRRSVRNPGTRGAGRLLGMTSGGGWNGGTCGAGRPSRPSFR